MKKQIISFKRAGQSPDGKPLYELDNSALGGQRPLPDQFRATMIFLPDEPTQDDPKTFAMQGKVLGNDNRPELPNVDKEL